MMGFTVLVLATLACLRFGSGQGDPLPLSLVELVTGSPIESFEDLQRLLDSDSVEKDPDGPLVQELLPNHTAPHRLPRSLGDIQVAEQAQCKVRTEVMEVSRSMLDRRNANFLLWPPCVEVQRCSGCCNTRNLQCVATVSRIRPLQVTKIQFVNKQPLYERAVISVEDHVECRCKSAVSANMPRTTARKPQSPPPPPKAPRLKSPSKEDIYQHDVLKQNQNFQLEELEGRQWQTQTPDTRSGTSGQGEPSTPSGAQPPLSAATWEGAEEKEVRREEELDSQLGDERPPERPGDRHTGTRLEAGQRLSHHHHSKAAEEKLPSESPAPGGGSTVKRRTEAVEPRPSLHPDAVTRHPQEHWPGSAHAGTTNQGPLSKEPHRDDKQLGMEIRRNQEEVEASKKEGLSDQERDQVQEQQARQQHHHHQQHLHQLHQQVHTTATKAAVAPPTTRSPAVMQTPSPFRPPRRRSSSLRRRLRKNRNRMSKTAMRAILM
ncbi:platelet-derived growth factor beta polypeptide a [Paramormyrops kingsleyae]|uniref:platelet-derived growth factor beta polypeptide a n=1 Tax=Paramormyrops kingsleyae TaxID=1676925 RepID=UPI003B971746